MTEQAETWDRIANWQFVLPPSRPAMWQLAHIRRVLLKIPRSAPVAILGSTPELRDLAADLGFSQIYIFEKSISAYGMMSKLRCFTNRENFVEGDWLDTLKNYTGTFAAILSDLTSGNISYDCRETFYSFVSKALRTDGVFIDKILTHSERFDELKRLDEEFHYLPINLETFNRFSCKYYFCSELLAASMEVKSEIFYEALASRFTHPKLTCLLTGSQLITPPGCRWWYGKPWDTLKREYFGYLKSMRMVPDVPDSPYAQRCRLYFLRRR